MMRRGALLGMAALLLGALAPAWAQQRPPPPRWPAWVAVQRADRLPELLLIEGRVERGTPPPPLPRDAAPQHRLLTTLRRLGVSGLPQATVAIELVATETATGAGRLPSPYRWRVTSDRSGYFGLRVSLPPSLPTPLIHIALDDADHQATPHTAAVREVRSGPGLAVVSDVDDTLIDSRVRDRAYLLATTLYAKVERQLPFVGAATLLSQLGGGLAPLYYLSGTPASLSDRLETLLRRHGFPPGSLLLKRLARDPLTDQLAYKFPRLLALVDSLPERRFILLGDSGEKDPEVYGLLAKLRPGRVAAILIHRVTAEPATAPRFSGQLLFDDYGAASAHLHELGLL